MAIFFDHAKIMRAHSGHPQGNATQGESALVIFVPASETLYLLWPLKSALNDKCVACSDFFATAVAS